MSNEMDIKFAPGAEANWKKFVSANCTDYYSFEVVVAASRVMRALDDGKTPAEALSAWDDCDLTGYMAGAAAGAVAQLHARGEEWRVFWNGQYGVAPEQEGTVNPAIVTIDSDKLDEFQKELQAKGYTAIGVAETEKQ